MHTSKLVKFVPGVDGLKTGWTNDAGYCLTATMNIDGMRVIAVVMGSSASDKRNLEITQLMNYGINNFEVIEKIPVNTIIKEISNIKTNPVNFNVIIDEPINIVKERGVEEKEFEYEVVINEQNIDNIGKLVIYYDKKVYKEVPLVLEQEIKKASYFDIFRSIVKTMLSTDN